MGFPVIRPRRLRATPSIRALVRETALAPSDFVYPLFFHAALEEPRPIRTMPGVFQLPVSHAAAQAREIVRRGVRATILFGLPKTKDANGSSALDPDGPVPLAVRAMKDAAPELVVITDVCVDEYTDHGHCGVLRTRRDGVVEVDNDRTVEILAQMSVVHAQAGADMVAPSDMMDGRVGAIRRALDAAGYQKTPILAYAAKFASVFYGPFREAADSAPQFGDRRSYQMDPANAREAMREIALDIQEGADMIMVKPALPYLDLIFRARRRFDLPIAAYQVSGEYSMIVATARNGWLDHDRAMMESLTSIVRAGAGIVLTYFAKPAARLLG